MPERKLVLALKCLLALGTGLALGAAAPQPPSILGLWENPRNTVKVEAKPCAGEVCGQIVWASDKAIADAREGGTANLVGTEILRSYRQVAPGNWQGEVFLPDMGETFFSRIHAVGGNQIKVSGCILHGLICKSQLWHRP